MSKYVVYLDDGHGKDTPGKRTPRFPDGHYMPENEFNAAVVRYLASILTAHGLTVIQISPESSDTPLTKRVQRANDHHRALMKKATFRSVLVSVHANAYGNGVTFNSANGVEVFYYSGRFKRESAVLARDVLAELLKGTPQTNRGVKTASFYMIRKPEMPSVLVEYAFMTNLREARLLDSDAFRRECAQETAAGICRYFGI
ncbi:MAG: N-acetylmuramoyl-L-alanine amidase family protein [Armatimonadota bacterium]